MLIELTGEQLDALEQKIAISQACVWAASEDLSEGSPYCAAGLIYSFSDLRELVETIREQEVVIPKKTG